MLHPNMEINLDGYFAKKCFLFIYLFIFFFFVVVFFDGWCRSRLGAASCGIWSGYALFAGFQHGDKFGWLFCWKLLLSWRMMYAPIRRKNAASDLGRRYSLRPNMEINLDSCVLLRIVGFPRGVYTPIRRSKMRRLIWVDIIRCAPTRR